MPLTEGTRLGSYEVTSAIGAGGMGEVYRARDSRLGRDVAIKVLPQAFASDVARLARFVREARTLASLNHPNIAQIYGLEDSGGLPALVMELVEGPTLADRIAQGPIPLEDTLSIARQLADALDTAHGRGIVHRDLKPANIKLDADRTVKVLDFGLAKLVEQEVPGGEQTTAIARLYDSPTLGFPVTTVVGTILGTAAYMSPEQARGRAVDKRADIWAFGVVLYEMLTGERPFKGEDASETIAAVIKETPSWERVPFLVRPLVQSCLEKDPRRRLRDIGDMWRVLDPARGEVGQAVPGTIAGARWIPWAIAGAAAAALAGTTMYFVTRPLPEQPSARFTIDAPPPASTFRFEVTGASVSPDGSMLVFSAFNQAGNALYVRRIDSLDTMALPGTENADMPFWSPDGRSIAFFASGTLKRVELDGGPPVVLCPSIGAFGGTWNRDGVILFASSAGISRIAASGGGDPVVVVKAEPGWHIGHPQFLPDQEHFLYYTRDARGQDLQTVGTSLSAPGRRTTILRTGYQARFAPSPGGGTGHLLYLRDMTLMAQPFDPIALRATGTAEPLAEHVMVLSADSAAYSVSETGVMVYRTGELATERSKILWMNRDGAILGEAAPEDFYSSMRISPDGTRAAVGRRNIIRQDDQWVLDFARGYGAMTRLTFDAARETWPVWSPDGVEVAFGANPTGAYELYRKAASGAGAQTQFTPATANRPSAGAGKRPSDWSRDGKYLIYTDTDPQSGDNIWALRVDTNPSSVIEVRNSRFEEFDAHFSPDGRWIAYISNESGREEVFVQAFNGDGGRTQASSQGGRAARWHPNGHELFYYNDESGRLMSVGIDVSSGTIKTGTPREVFTVPLPRGVTAPWDIAPDGERFLVLQLQPQPRRPPLTVVTNWPATLTRPR